MQYRTTLEAQALTVRQFCQRYAVGRTYAFDEMASGALIFYYAGRHRRISVDAAETWFRAKQAAKSRGSEVV